MEGKLRQKVREARHHARLVSGYIQIAIIIQRCSSFSSTWKTYSGWSLYVQGSHILFSYTHILAFTVSQTISNGDLILRTEAHLPLPLVKQHESMELDDEQVCCRLIAIS